jgi:hypothetical protein
MAKGQSRFSQFLPWLRATQWHSCQWLIWRGSTFYSGQLLRSRVPDESDSFSLADLIITSVAAMALSGFGLLFLGFARLLNHFGMLIALDLAERGSEGRRA